MRRQLQLKLLACLHSTLNLLLHRILHLSLYIFFFFELLTRIFIHGYLTNLSATLRSHWKSWTNILDIFMKMFGFKLSLVWNVSFLFIDYLISCSIDCHCCYWAGTMPTRTILTITLWTSSVRLIWIDKLSKVLFTWLNFLNSWAYTRSTVLVLAANMWFSCLGPLLL